MSGWTNELLRTLGDLEFSEHSALTKRMSNEGDDTSAAKLLNAPRSSVTLRVFFSGMSTSIKSMSTR